MFERLHARLWRWLPGFVSHILTSVGLLAMVLGTLRTLSPPEQRLLYGAIMVVWGCIVTVFLYRLWSAWVRPERRAYLTTADGLIDLVATLSLPLGWLLVADPRDLPLFAVVWTLRYIRHSTGLQLFWRVMLRSSMVLLSIASLFLVVFLTTATLAYVFERAVQPQIFGSVPGAMWWAIVTLTTTGYGDYVPATLWGRLLSGWVMVGGTVMFALQAGIIATAFAEELKRRHFLHTWDLVMSVPFFQGLGAATVADIVRLGQTRDVAEGTVLLRRGEPGDAMYFIITGEVVVQLPRPVTLGPGSFFGEMALLFGAPRSATILASRPSVLLVIDIADFRELASRRSEVINAIEAEAKRRLAENTALSQLG
jgi:voltage-gated potassium channel